MTLTHLRSFGAQCLTVFQTEERRQTWKSILGCRGFSFSLSYGKKGEEKPTTVVKVNKQGELWTKTPSQNMFTSFFDSKPTEENPYPTLFPRNNFKQPLKERSQNAILKREQSCRETETDHCQSEDYILPSAFPIFDTQLNREVLCPVSSDIEVTTTTMKRGKIQ